jgi:uncharacterized membrane protein
MIDRLLGIVALAIWAVSGAAIWALYGVFLAVVLFAWVVPLALMAMLLLASGSSAATSSMPMTTRTQRAETDSAPAREHRASPRPYAPYSIVR